MSAKKQPIAQQLFQTWLRHPSWHWWRRHWFNALLVGVALSALAVALAQHRHAQAELTATQVVYQQQQSINSAGQQAALLLARYQEPYRLLQDRGVIGDAQRLQWVEALNASVNEQLLPQVRFTLAPTQAATLDNTSYYHESLSLKVTPMRLDFSLLHEGDFYRMMTDLRRHAKGVFSAQSCELQHVEQDTRPAAGASPADDSEQLLNTVEHFKGDCDLLWYSLADIRASAAL